MSKKTSSEKYRLGLERYPKKKNKPEKKSNNVSQKMKANQFLVKRPKNKEPRKSSKMVGKNFEFSKLGEENKWRKSLKNNFVFVNNS